MHTLVLQGELDRSSAATFELAIEKLCETDVAQITLDMSKLTRIDATGAAVIAFRCGWCQRRGREVALICGPRPVQHVFELAGLAERLPFLAGCATAEPPEEVLVPASAHAPLDEQLIGEAPPEARERARARLLISGRRSRARRAGRGRLAEGV
jgi:anti-anti-sigma factor